MGLVLSFGHPNDARAMSVRDFSDLRGWDADNHQAALVAFRETCDKSRHADLRRLCKIAAQDIKAKPFFELFFKPVLISDPKTVLFTGYFEPVLKGSRLRSSQFNVPVYSKPPVFPMGAPNVQRSNIVENGILAGQGLELAFVANEVDLFYAQVQGSVSIALPSGQIMRLGYGGHNGHPYRSVGTWLAGNGYIKPHQASQKFIKNWIAQNPSIGHRALMQSPGYVFFRQISSAPKKGPLGALSKPLTPLRSIAIDPDYYMMGGLFWVEKGGNAPLRRLMVAQDTGSAIQTAQRVDIFYGTGEKAGENAASVKDYGTLYALMPIDTVYAFFEERKDR